jgi:hypothetical protein
MITTAAPDGALPTSFGGTNEMMIRNQRAFAAGALFVAVALFFFLVSMNYTLGTAARMGPGYFPVLLSILLGAIGLVVLAGSVTSRAQIEKLKSWDLKGLLWIVGSVALFAVLLYPLGFVIALFALVMVSSKASPEFGWAGAFVNAAVLIVMCVAAFVYGIGLQLPLWPSFFN